jgi:hypothetical protein
MDALHAGRRHGGTNPTRQRGTLIASLARPVGLWIWASEGGAQRRSATSSSTSRAADPACCRPAPQGGPGAPAASTGERDAPGGLWPEGDGGGRPCQRRDRLHRHSTLHQRGRHRAPPVDWGLMAAGTLECAPLHCLHQLLNHRRRATTQRSHHVTFVRRLVQVEGSHNPGQRGEPSYRRIPGEYP